MREAWPGLDLMTVDSGINPLLASYVGAPHQVRGTDPASYALNARDWWASLGETPQPGNGVTPSGSSGNAPNPWNMNPFTKEFWTGPFDAGQAAADSVKSSVLTSVGGMLLALIVVAVGLLVLSRS